MIQLKYVAEEAAAAAAQYYDPVQYSNGKKVFNQTEGNRAAEYVIRANLNLDNSFTPIGVNYWRDKVNYTIEYFDDSNTTYPLLYTHNSSLYVQAIGDPTVVVTIDVGRPRYSIVSPPGHFFRSAAHEWKQR